jgi:uncharacterized protein YegL
MSDQNYTAMLVILDRSGSMTGHAAEMQAATQNLIDTQAAEPGLMTVDVVTFDDKIEHTHGFAQPADVKVSLVPRGATALYDAIGTAFSGFGSAIAALPAHARPSTVLVTIVTDGHENASQEYTSTAVKQLIESKRRDDWDISFLGANQDAVLAAGNIGIDRKDAMTFDMGNIAPTMAAHNAKQSRRRQGDRSGYTEAERTTAMNRDAS